MDIWPVSWTKWVIGEREGKKNQSESAIETQGDRMFIYCRLELHSGCEWKAVLSWTSHPLRPNSTRRQCSPKEGLHTVTKSPKAHTHTLSESISTLHTQTEPLKLLRCTYTDWISHFHTHTQNTHTPVFINTGFYQTDWVCWSQHTRTELHTMQLVQSFKRYYLNLKETKFAIKSKLQNGQLIIKLDSEPPIHRRTHNNNNPIFSSKAFLFYVKKKKKMALQLKTPWLLGCANFKFAYFIFLLLRNAKKNCIYMLWWNSSQCQQSIISRKRDVGAVLLEKLTSDAFLNKVLHETIVMGGPRAWGAWPWDSWSLEWV